MNISEAVGARIKERQKILNIKQVDIIKRTGLSKAALSNYTNGNRLPETEALYKISVVLNTTMEWLLTGKTTDENITEEERILLNNYRTADFRGKKNILRTAQAEADQAADAPDPEEIDQGKLLTSKIG